MKFNATEWKVQLHVQYERCSLSILDGRMQTAITVGQPHMCKPCIVLVKSPNSKVIRWLIKNATEAESALDLGLHVWRDVCDADCNRTIYEPRAPRQAVIGLERQQTALLSLFYVRFQCVSTQSNLRRQVGFWIGPKRSCLSGARRDCIASALLPWRCQQVRRSHADSVHRDLACMLASGAVHDGMQLRTRRIKRAGPAAKKDQQTNLSARSPSANSLIKRPSVSASVCWVKTVSTLRWVSWI